MKNEKISADELLAKAKEGCLTYKDMDRLIEIIENAQPGKDDEDLFTVIYALGKTDQVKYRNLVERFLIYPSDSMVSKAALTTLCKWDLTEYYLNEIKQFLRGVKWDVGDTVRITAIYRSADYLRFHFDKVLLQLLVDLFEKLGQDPSLKDCEFEEEREHLKKCAYDGLALAMGVGWETIFAERGVDPKIVEKAHQLLESK